MKAILKKIFWRLYFFNSSKYSKNEEGTFSKIRLIFLNIFKPGRLINRIRYGQLLFDPIRNKKKLIDKLKKNPSFIKDEKNEMILNAFNTLCSEGATTIPEYFSVEAVENFKKKNESLINEIKTKNQEITGYVNDIVPLSRELIDLWLDDRIIYLIQSFFGRNVYARNYPLFNFTRIKSSETKENLLKAKLNNKWHIDHSVLFNVHVILEDLDKSETCMEIIPKSHKYLNLPYNYSDKIIEELKLKNKTVTCYGKKGTIYMHTGNLVHRLKPVPGSNRTQLHFEFCPGANILLNCNNIFKSLKDGFDLETLSNSKREIVSSIFPKDIFKGYDKINNKFIPTRFKGI